MSDAILDDDERGELGKLLKTTGQRFFDNLKLWKKSSNAEARQQALGALEADTSALCRPFVGKFLQLSNSTSKAIQTKFATELARHMGKPAAGQHACCSCSYMSAPAASCVQKAPQGFWDGLSTSSRHG